MPEVRHLSSAPIVEALVNFQANAARLWKPDEIRPALAARWPEHAEIQELRPVQIEVTQTPQGPQPPKVNIAHAGFHLPLHNSAERGTPGSEGRLRFQQARPV